MKYILYFDSVMSLYVIYIDIQYYNGVTWVDFIKLNESSRKQLAFCMSSDRGYILIIHRMLSGDRGAFDSDNQLD